MKDKVFIIADSFGVLRMTKRAPTLRREEVAVALTVTIPDGCFKHPTVTASLDVPDDRVMQPSATITVDVPPVEEPAQ